MKKSFVILKFVCDDQFFSTLSASETLTWMHKRLHAEPNVCVEVRGVTHTGFLIFDL